MKKRERYKRVNVPFAKWPWLLLYILALPIVIAALIVRLIWRLKEYPKYKDSYSKKVDGIKYSHTFFRSDSFELNELLHKENLPIRIAYENNQSIYFEGKSHNYMFLESNSWFFGVKDGHLYISDDGLPFVDAKEFLIDKGPKNDKETILLLSKEEAVNLNYELIDISRFPEVIIEESIEGFVNALKNEEVKSII